MKFDAYLAADFIWAKLPRGTKRIQTFHGVAGKYGNVYDRPDHSLREWDRLFFINQRRLNNFISAGAIDADSPAICLIGMPKADCLVDGSLQRDDIPKFAGDRSFTAHSLVRSNLDALCIAECDGRRVGRATGTRRILRDCEIA